jgi:hypothetical protein
LIAGEERRRLYRSLTMGGGWSADAVPGFASERQIGRRASSAEWL